MNKFFAVFIITMLGFSASAFAAKGTIILRGFEDCSDGVSSCVKYDAQSNTRLSRVVGDLCAIDVENQTPTQQATAVRNCAAAAINSADPSRQMVASNLNIQ